MIFGREDVGCGPAPHRSPRGGHILPPDGARKLAYSIAWPRQRLALFVYGPFTI